MQEQPSTAQLGHHVPPRSELRIMPGWPMPLGSTVREGGVHFALYSRHARRVWLCLFDSIDDRVPAVEFQLDPDTHRFGDVWSAFVEGLAAGALYAYRVDGPNRPTQGHRYNARRFLLDPYARCMVGDIQHGHGKCVVMAPPAHLDSFPHVPMANTIIYEVHLRGFTRHPSSGVEHPGSYRGLIEKIPYLKELGITAVELLPVQQTGKLDLGRCHPVTGEPLTNYWCYDPIGFFAPMAHYASGGGRGEQVEEFRAMVAALHEAGIEVILDVVFNHTAESEGHHGLFLSYRGLENSTYYLVDDTGHYRDYTGCGNTVNCNHPVVQDLIIDCLRAWVLEMQIDGFRFDLATILKRDEHGHLQEASPLVQRIGQDPVLRKAKLIAEPWDAGGGYQVGSFAGRRWAEWNDRFRIDVRAYWVGENSAKPAFAKRLIGSPDVYGPGGRSPLNSVNYVTAHDGFCLRDYVSYNVKHNEANGEHNRDGSDFNQSWNFGVEGETTDPRINALRLRMQKSLLATLFLSVGVPMLCGGDEFGRTQRGNNNPYCQDNDITWFDWTLLDKNAELLRFSRKVIEFRKQSPFFTQGAFPRTLEGLPQEIGRDYDVLWLNAAGHPQTWTREEPSLGMWINGACNGGTSLYLMFNSSLDPITYRLPEGRWFMRVNTAKPMPDDIVEPERAVRVAGGTVRVSAKTLVVLSSPCDHP